MQKELTKYEERRRKLTLNILRDLYNLRALTTEQISRRFVYSMPHTYRITQELRAKHLILTESVKGYVKGKPRQGDYHRITTKGIELLNQADFDTSRTADQLRVSDYHLPYVLLVNELVIDLEPHGWKIINGRDVKNKYNLNRGDNIHGMLISPESTKYAIYIFNGLVTPKNLGKIKKEVGRYNQFTNILMLTKSKDSFYQIFNEFKASDDIFRYLSFSVLPFSYGIRYLKSLNTEEALMNFIQQFDVTRYPEADISEAPIGLKTVVIHEDEEKYFVNMLNNDLRKLNTIRYYRKERYEEDGRRVLIATNIEETYPKLLSDIHHIDYLHVPR